MLTRFTPFPREMRKKLFILLPAESALLFAVLDESWAWAREWTPPTSIREWADSTDMTLVTCRRAVRVLIKCGVLEREAEGSSRPSGQRYRVNRAAIPTLEKSRLQAIRLEVQSRDAAGGEQGRLPWAETQITERPGSPRDPGHQEIVDPDHQVIQDPDHREIWVEDVENPPGHGPVAANSDQRQIPSQEIKTIPRPSSADDGMPAPEEAKPPGPPDNPLLPDTEVNRRVDYIASIVHRDIKSDWRLKSPEDPPKPALRSEIWKVVSGTRSIHEKSPEFLASVLADGCRTALARCNPISHPPAFIASAFSKQWGVQLETLDHSLRESAAARAQMGRRRQEQEEEERLRADPEWRAAAKRRIQEARAAIAAGGAAP